MKTRNTIRTLLFVMIFLLAATGCRKDELAGDRDGKQAGGSAGAISLTLRLGLDRSSRAARAAGRTGAKSDSIRRPGVDEEDRIQSLYLFFEDIRDDGMFGNRIFFRFDDIPSFNSPEKKIKLTVSGSQLTFGRKRVFVGANLSESQAIAFVQRNAAYTISVSDQEKFKYELTEVYAPGRGIGMTGKTPVGRKDIAMFCIEEQELELEEGKTDYVFPESFELERLVAKVLVTCKTKDAGSVVGGESGEQYCRLTGDLLDENNEDRGWIRQKDVLFMVNALNLKTFIMQKRVWNTQEQQYEYPDPNYDRINDYFAVTNGIVVPQPRGEFFYNAVQVLNDYNTYYAETLPHNDAKLPRAGNANARKDFYYEGLYCPENTFTTRDIPEADHLVLSEYNYPWPMITHVSITAKFTPRELYVERAMLDYLKNASPVDQIYRTEIEELIAHGSDPGNGFGDSIVVVKAPSEKISQAILTASLRKYYEVQAGDVYHHDEAGFPENTYLSVTDQDGVMRFYTYGAALCIAKMNGWKPEIIDPETGEKLDNPYKNLASFKAMPRGRGYYYTYIDSRRNAELGQAATYAHSQVLRNTYYILTLNTFSTTGRTGSEPEYVKVHTHVVDWKEGGQADVTLN